MKKHMNTKKNIARNNRSIKKRKTRKDQRWFEREIKAIDQRAARGQES